MQTEVIRLWKRVRQAMQFAYRAHEGQTYKGYGRFEDSDYIHHPLRVMFAVPMEMRVVALLHDCMEDAGVLPDWLDSTERAAIRLLTRRKGEDSLGEYGRYIQLIAEAPGEVGRIARWVKIEDLKDNLAHDPPERLRKRYEMALKILEEVG